MNQPQTNQQILPLNSFKSETSCSTNSASSEVQRLKDEIKVLNERLTQSQRNTALGELVSTTTHEFNNVLMTVLNYAKMGMRHKDVETRDKAFEKILKAGQRAAKITNSVLGMARNRTNQFEATNLENLIDETMVLLERELQKYRISVEINVQPELPEVFIVGNQIQQVLLNLVINARQAMSEGGQLIIGLVNDPASKMVELSVRDFGPGMSQDQLRKIFQPYFTTKDGPDESGKGGTGLGLAACKSIIESHGGKIRVQSSLGKGTCFTLKLPIKKQEVAAPKGIAGAIARMNANPGSNVVSG